MLSENKIAIVTGASTGLGQSISIKLAQKGYEIVLASRNKQKLNHLKNLISENGGVAKVIIADVSKEDDVKNLYSKINLNNVEIVVNNAGFGIFNKLHKIKSNEWDAQINTNLRGPFLMSRYIIENMIARKSGKLVFINSVAGISAYPFSSAYVASKFGLRGFASILREELREHNKKVISIHPGAINTPFWDNVNVDFSREQMLSPESVANDIVNAMYNLYNIYKYPQIFI